MSSRQFAPDLLKAVAIFGVVYIHTTWMFPHPATQVLSDLFRAAVPCFIILWAYFFEKAMLKGKPMLSYTIKRTGHIFLVFVLWSLIHLFFKETWTMPTVLSWLVRHFSGGAWPGQYFFLILLQLIPLFWLLRWVYERKWLRWALLCAVVLLYFVLSYGYDQLPFIIQKLSVRPFIYHIPYVFVGIALARGVFPNWPALCAMALLAIPIEFFLLSSFGMSYAEYLTPTVLLGSISLTAVVLQSDMRTPQASYLRKPIVALGTATLTIFVANPLILRGLACLTQGIRPEAPDLAMAVAGSILLAAITCGIALGLTALISKCRLKGILN